MLTSLGCTIIDWQTYITSHTHLGIPPPTRAIDTAGLDTKSPASFLATVGGGTPLENLRRAYVCKHTDLISLLFLIESDERLLAALHSTRLTVVNYGEISFLNGTLTQYMDAIIACSTAKHPLLKLCNALYVYLDRGGFRECFCDYTRDANGTTFTLKHR